MFTVAVPTLGRPFPIRGRREGRRRISSETTRAGGRRRLATTFTRSGASAPATQDTGGAIELTPRVRRTVMDLRPTSIDDAATQMDAAGRDYQLFVESGTGQAGVLLKTRYQGYFLELASMPAIGLDSFSVRMTVCERIPPLLTAAEAVQRFTVCGGNYLFFFDAEWARGSLVHRGAGGHFSVLTPAA